MMVMMVMVPNTIMMMMVMLKMVANMMMMMTSLKTGTLKNLKKLEQVMDILNKVIKM